MMGAIERAPDDVALRAAAVGYLDDHRHELLGPGVSLLASSFIGWYGGFVDELRIQPGEGTTAAEVIQLIEHPMCRFVRHLALGRIPELPDVIAALVAAELPLLEELVVHDALWGKQAELCATTVTPTTQAQAIVNSTACRQPDWPAGAGGGGEDQEVGCIVRNSSTSDSIGRGRTRTNAEPTYINQTPNNR